MGDARHAALGWVQVEIEHAIGASKLQLCPVALANLELRPSKMLEQLIGRHAAKRPVIMLVGHGRGRRGTGGLRWSWRRRWPRGTGRDEQHGCGDQVTHRPLVAGREGAGKLAGAGQRG